MNSLYIEIFVHFFPEEAVICIDCTIIVYIYSFIIQLLLQ